YRGELLPGYYEAWIPPEQQRLLEAQLQALRQLVRHSARRRDFSSALDYARRAASLDASREELHRDLMRLYVAAGQPSAALQQYRDLEQTLRQTLGQKPVAATRQLSRQIEAHLQREAEPVAPAHAPVLAPSVRKDPTEAAF